ncbi:MAG TPA: hypothetical protein PK388_03860 [Kiritimatiellia bacterium]|nr:hypothetical protein [Kiritimatiellia bacterium]
MERTTDRPPSIAFQPGMPDRRRGKPDAWSVVFRLLTLLVYPLLVVFLFIFFGVASQDHSRALAMQFGRSDGAGSVSHADLYAVLPLLLAGLLIGAAGLVLSRKRARRRWDYNCQTQLALVLLSAGGLAVFFILR